MKDRITTPREPGKPIITRKTESKGHIDKEDIEQLKSFIVALQNAESTEEINRLKADYSKLYRKLKQK